MLVILLNMAVGISLLREVYRVLVRQRPAWPRLRTRDVCVALLCGVFIIHFGLSGITTSWDSKWSIHTALSIVREGNTDLDEYFPITQQFQDHTVAQYWGHTYNLYPVGTSLLAVPVVWLVDKFMDAGWLLDTEQFLNEYRLIPSGIEKCAASMIVALASVIVYLIGLRSGYRQTVSILVTLIFAFGTSAWSTASRALWQHGPTMLMLALALYLLIRAEHAPQRAYWAIRLLGLPLAFSFVIRPTNAISIAAFSVLVFLQYRKQFLAYCLWGMAVAVPFALYSLHTYHTLLPPYYCAQGQLGGGVSAFFEALAGTLISPSRGLFVFSPVLLFSMYGIILSLRTKPVKVLDKALLWIMLLHWIVSALHPRWWAGHSYGPRYLSDMLPFLIYFLLPAIHRLRRVCQSWKRTMLLILLIVSAGLSVGIHWRGATSQDVYGWNAGPVNVDVQPARVWDWRDPQFLRGF